MSTICADPPAPPIFRGPGTGGRGKQHYKMVEDGDVHPAFSFHRCTICWCEPGEVHRNEYH